MKKLNLLFAFLLLISPVISKAQLAAGDIAFIGFNTDADEGFSFITLTDIPGSEEIYFTDYGIVNGTMWNLSVECYILFTAPPAGIPCGTIVSITEGDPEVLTISGAPGSAFTLTGSFNFGSGDQVIAFQTDEAGFPATPSLATFIAGIHSDYDPTCLDPVTTWSLSACVSNTSESALPPGLTNGVNCLSQNPAGPEVDNGKYNGTLTGTSTALRAAINDHTNWILSDAGAYAINPGDYPTPSVTCVAPCTNPTVPTVTFSPGTVCAGGTVTLTISGTLNDATAWKIYSGSCGGTLEGTTAGTTFVVTPGSPSTTYFVRGEGGCVSPGSCGTVTVTVTPLDNATFNYGAAAYCVNATDPTPTISGLAGGTFTSGAGLSINASTGTIDVSASTPGTYTVTYTTAGTCPNSSSVSVTINALDNATFNYGAAAYCVNATDPTPTISGLAGGTFTSGAGLSINASTGTIDVSASTPGTYTVTYTTAGTCPNSSSVSVTINALDNATFNYGAAAYCVNATDPTPTISGLAGGTFTSGAGLSINASTGTIDVSASTPGTYTVTYTTAGTCPNSSSVSLTINAADDASFSYGAASYCVSASDPTPTITGLAGGTFTSGAGLSINASTGTIDVSASTPGTYTVTYTTSGTCPNSSGVSVTITSLDDASFSYGAAAYCVSASDPTPTITGIGGGTFTSGAGLSINASTGTIDVSASTPGTYTVAYTTVGACANSSSVSVTINALDDASFSYGAATYCANGTDPTPTITGLAGGAFSSGAGLSINATTGAIDVSASTPGTYTVTYTTSGSCPNSSGVSVIINAADNAAFNYGVAAYCVDDSDPTPTILGLAGGTFTSGAGLSINPSTGTIDVSASTPGTYTVTYTTVGACPNSSSVSVTINALDNATFNYGAAAYCQSATDPTPTISGLAGGTFTSGAGLSINASTGTIDVSASTPGTYTVTYTTAGTCPNSSSVSVTINALDNATFNYGAAAYCVNATDPTPTISGLAGGTFTSGAGLSINASTGTIDVSASTPGTYTVTYTTAGTCPNSSSVSVTINALDNATFNYGAATYCQSETDPTPTISGLAGGTFTSGAGLSINASTGTIDVSASTPGTYTVTYTTSGTCPNSSSVSVTINASDDASFSYDSPSYCLSESDPTPTITGLAGGIFTTGAGLVINASTGTIDISASTPGTYTVTYTTAGSCPNTSSVAVSITTLDDADFAYDAPTYCPNGTDPTPTITGVPGGTFSSAPFGLVINALTGEIDLSASTEGTYIITYTTSGICANSSTASVTVLDDTDPVPTVAVLSDITAECEVTSLIAPTATDNCGGTITVTHDATLPITTQGTTIVTWTYEDENGNTSSQTQNVVIDDVTPPTAVLATLPDVTAQCEVVSLTPPTATDNCGGIIIVTNDATLPITDQGTTIVTWTYDDGNGNTSAQTQNIVIDDVTPPTADLATLADFTAECEVTTLTPPTATDNCGGSVTVSNDAILPITDQGTTIVTWTYEDENGNTSTQTQNIVIDDVTDPIILDCPDALTVLANTPICSAIVSWTEPTITDNCTGVTYTSTHSSGDTFPLGTTTVIYTATDIGGNESTCSFDITVYTDLAIDADVTGEMFGGDGAIDITVTGGEGGEFGAYDYDWDIDGTGDFDDDEDLTDLTVGFYIIEVMDEIGCTVSEIIEVELTCTPLTAEVSDFVICENELLTLDATSESGATITWDMGVIDAVPFTPGTPGTITYTATSESDEDCPYSVDIEVLPAPTVMASAGDENICDGDEVILAAGGDADTYTWDPTDLSPPVGVTTYTLTGTFTETGCENTSTVDVTVHALPTVTANADREFVCEGLEVTLTGAGALDYEWEPATITDGVGFVPGPIGSYSYTVVGTDINGCSNEDVVEITVVTPITITVVVTDIMGGSDGAIDITVTGGTPPYMFDWNNDGTGDFDDDEDLTGLNSGFYEVTVIGEAGCETTKLVFVDSQLGITELGEISFKLYPNPTIDNLTIELDGTFQYAVYSLDGKLAINGQSVNKETFSVESLADGAYLIEIRTENGVKRTQFVKN